MRPRLSILKTGDTAPGVLARYGDFDWMFRRYLAAADCEVRQIHKGDALPPPDAIDGVIITGSPSSITAPEDWVEPLAAWTRRAIDHGTPTLGVCYGHQLLAHAFGGRVEKNPRGYEIGTISVDLTDAGARDPLLGGDAAQLRFQTVHSDVVTELPPGAVVLAKNAKSDAQAFALGERVRAVQFHPEICERVMRQYVRDREELVRKDAISRGEDPERAIERVLAGIEPTPLGPGLLARFVDRFVIGRTA